MHLCKRLFFINYLIILTFHLGGTSFIHPHIVAGMRSDVLLAMRKKIIVQTIVAITVAATMSALFSSPHLVYIYI